MSSYAHVVHTTAKQVISRRRKNENVYKMTKNEKCTCKACKNAVFHCQLCKFVGFFLPSSSGLLKPSESEILRKQDDAVLQNTKKATEYGLKVSEGNYKRRVYTSFLQIIIVKMKQSSRQQFAPLGVILLCRAGPSKTNLLLKSRN